MYQNKSELSNVFAFVFLLNYTKTTYMWGGLIRQMWEALMKKKKRENHWNVKCRVCVAVSNLKIKNMSKKLNSCLYRCEYSQHTVSGFHYIHSISHTWRIQRNKFDVTYSLIHRSEETIILLWDHKQFSWRVLVDQKYS